MKNNSNNSNNNRVSFIVILAFVVFVCYFTINYDKYFTSKSEKLECNNYGNASLLEIYEAKSNNELDARNKYLNKSFNFTGKVSSVNYNEFTKGSYLMIEDGYITVEVYINDSQKELAEKLIKDENITFCATVSDLNPLIGAALSLKNATITGK